MGWVKFENTMPENLKVAPVNDRAFRLWVNAICYCSRAQTDGRVPARLITSLSSSATKRSVAELLDAGLLDQMDERTYLVHDYLDHNPSRDRIEELREDARERTAKWRGHKPVRDASQNHHPRVRDRSGSSCYDTEVRHLCEKLDAHIRANDPKAVPRPESERWQRDMRLLVKDRGWSLEAVAEVDRIIDWSQSDAFWRSNILSPGKLRKQFTTLLLRADAPTFGGSERKARGDRRLAALERLASGGDAA